MLRRSEPNNGKLVSPEDEVEGFLNGNPDWSALKKTDISRRYKGRRVSVIITRNEGTLREWVRDFFVPHSLLGIILNKDKGDFFVMFRIISLYRGVGHAG
ncbi:MAG: hypothetical protein QW812_05295 [Thermoplasmataceae archaeon]